MSQHHDHKHGHYEKVDPNLFQRPADCCEDQIPVTSHIGRGLQGDSYRVVVTRQDSDEMYIRGERYDEATRTWHREWESNNLSGGELLPVEYNYRPYTDPPTFTMTFKYRHPSTPGADGSPYQEWSHTTNAIPYYPLEEDANNLIGSGLANLYLRQDKASPWVDLERHGSEPPSEVTDSKGRWGQLNWPIDYEPKDFRTPDPDEKWSATITFGIDGDIKIPNYDELSKIIGITVEQMYQIINGDKNIIKPPGDGPSGDNLYDYINKRDEWYNDHVHTDMGFGNSLIGDTPGSLVPAFNPDFRPKRPLPFTIKNYIEFLNGSNLDYTDEQIEELKQWVQEQIDNIYQTIEQNNSMYDSVITSILQKIQGNNTYNSTTKVITWDPSYPDSKVPVGNINVTSGGPTGNNGLFTRAKDTNNDLDFQ